MGCKNIYSREIQIEYACLLQQNQYIKRLKVCLPSNGKMSNITKTYNYSKSELEEMRDRTIESACNNNQLYYHPTIKICIKERIDKMQNVQKLDYERLREEHCKSDGRYYNTLADECIRTDLIQKSHAMRVFQIREMCTYSNLEYDDELQLCVMKRTAYEKAMPAIPIITSKTKQYGRLICLRAGMDFEEFSEQCIHFDDTERMRQLRRVLQNYIDIFFDKFCKISNLHYSKLYGFCIDDSGLIHLEDYKQVNTKISGKLYRGNEEYNRHLCFMHGLQAVVNLLTTSCEEFPAYAGANVLRARYSQNRRQYILSRCPVYSEYNDDLGFCIRRTPKQMAIITRSKGHRSEVDLDKICCLQNGLDYNEITTNCQQFQIRPTFREIRKYYGKFTYTIDYLFRLYCKKLNRYIHPVSLLCVK
ncbi:hypothetical protein GJ496_008964 [Pomphorhynchus laevis]|nr:hypothetical protein GJ496_008964 [Pomphorhynchus laevis]